MNETPSQAFRVRSSSEVITIPTRHDPKSGQRVVRWIDIERHIEGAKTVLNAKEAALFLTNDDLEDLVPYRIAHYPGVVLEVVVEDNTRGDSSTTDTFQSHPQYSLALSRYNPVLNASQFARDDHPPMLLPGVGGDTGQDEQLQQLKQQMQQVQRQIEEILQKLHDSEQRTQHFEQQTHQTHQSLQELRQQTGDALKKVQQLQEWANETDRGNSLPLEQIQGGFSKRQLETLNRCILINKQIETILENRLKGPSTSCLFIVLPKNPNLRDGQEATSSRLFRVHVLCEHGYNTMTNGPSKVSQWLHMTNHAGYDIKRPKEFFERYGPYVLAMMHMIKYGTTAFGFVVPPLARSLSMEEMEQDQAHLGISKYNIEQLVDETIAYLEEATHTADNNMYASSHWSLENDSLEDLHSYLEISEGAQFPVDLYQSATQHCNKSWMCSEHHRGRIVRHLKEIANGSYDDNTGMIDIKIESEKTAAGLLDAVIEFTGFQCTNDKPSLTMDCGRFSLTVNVSHDLQDVILTIKDLKDLATDDVEFIKRCNITETVIERTPETEVEERLTDILRSPKLKKLRIECKAERSLAVIGLVISVREETLQDGQSTGLQALQLRDGVMEHFDLDRYMDSAHEKCDHLATTLTFSEGSTRFEMDTSITLRNATGVDEGEQICNFFRQFGWSISSLTTSWKLQDHLVALLDNTTQIHGSRLTHLVFSPYSLTASGLDSMDRVIKRSQSLIFTTIEFSMLQEKPQQETMVSLLGRYGSKLNAISMAGSSIEHWLPQVADKFPTKDSFPALEKLTVYCRSRQQVPQGCVQWLVAMISAPPRALGSMRKDSCAGASQQKTGSLAVTSPLLRLRLDDTDFSQQEWETVIKAIDFSVMVELKMQRTNFSQEQLDLLLECIAHVDAESLPLEKLSLTGTDVLANAADEAALRARIQGVAPRVTVV